MKIAIIGKGNVGSALCTGLSGKHEMKFGHRDPAEPVADAAKWGEVISSCCSTQQRRRCHSGNKAVC